MTSRFRVILRSKTHLLKSSKVSGYPKSFQISVYNHDSLGLCAIFQNRVFHFIRKHGRNITARELAISGGVDEWISHPGFRRDFAYKNTSSSYVDIVSIGWS